MSNLTFLGSSRNSKLLTTSQWIWIEKNPTVHLHDFISHRENLNVDLHVKYDILQLALLVGEKKVSLVSLQRQRSSSVTFPAHDCSTGRKREKTATASMPVSKWQTVKQFVVIWWFFQIAKTRRIQYLLILVTIRYAFLCFGHRASSRDTNKERERRKQL